MDIVASTTDSVRTASRPSIDWQTALRTAIRDPADLCRRLEIPQAYWPSAERAARLFPVFAPLGFVARMKPGDPADPLLRQVLPLDDELHETPGFSGDPVGDLTAELQPGLLQKYAGRALLVTTGVCAIHCRYCFRREFPYSSAPKSIDQWLPALAAIERDVSIEEVLLSGGDPLTVVDAVLLELIDRLQRIGHLRRLRLHTRLPIVIPQRASSALLECLGRSRLRSIVVVHANHPAELDASVATALGKFSAHGIPLLNQAVLLRSVNDNASALCELSQRLVELSVMPYYLHQLDRVRGAAHFEVPVSRGRELIAQLRAALPGYAVPRYVKEVAGETSKRVLA